MKKMTTIVTQNMLISSLHPPWEITKGVFNSNTDCMKIDFQACGWQVRETPFFQRNKNSDGTLVDYSNASFLFEIWDHGKDLLSLVIPRQGTSESHICNSMKFSITRENDIDRIVFHTHGMFSQKEPPEVEITICWRITSHYEDTQEDSERVKDPSIERRKNFAELLINHEGPSLM